MTPDNLISELKVTRFVFVLLFRNSSFYIRNRNYHVSLFLPKTSLPLSLFLSEQRSDKKIVSLKEIRNVIVFLFLVFIWSIKIFKTKPNILLSMTRRLLLLSNSTLHPTGYLEYAQDHICNFLNENNVDKVRTKCLKVRFSFLCRHKF